jgi:glycosyltransferase involved in cell wall biosynthesis
MKPIRVLQIISGFAIEGPLGGIERFGVELAQALAAGGQVEPLVCGMWAYQTPYEAAWLSRLQAQGIDAFMPAVWDDHSPYRSFWRAWQGTRRHLHGQQVEIIHSHCQFGDGLALLLKRELGAKAVVRTVHNEREWGKRPLRHLLLTNGLYPLRFQQELGVSQQVVDNLNQRPLAKKLGKTAVLAYNALNVSRFANVQVDRAEKRRELGLPANAPIIGSVGRLTEQKAYDLFLEAAALVKAHLPEAHFLLVGDGPLAADLQTQAEELGLSPHIIFTGARADVEELLQIMDVFVNSSRWEGLPTVMLESMASRIPVVATDVSGNRELVRDGENGRLVPPNDPSALAQAIRETLALPPDQRQTMCQTAFDLVQATFSITQIARQHETLYDLLINGKAPQIAGK